MNKQLSSEDAVAAYGDRFEMVLAASQRARELKNGHAAKVLGKNGPSVTALNEIEQGKYTREDFLKTIKLIKYIKFNYRLLTHHLYCKESNSLHLQNQNSPLQI